MPNLKNINNPLESKIDLQTPDYPDVDIYNMSLHDREYLAPTLVIMAVPGGWIYEYWQKERGFTSMILKSTVFVSR